MGFFKFLKREKKRDEFSELDLPPAPPPLEGFEGAPADFGADFAGFDDKLPELPDIPDLGEEDFSDKESAQAIDKEANIPDFPIYPDLGERSASIQPVSAPSGVPQPPTTPLPAPESEPAAQTIQSPPTPEDIFPRIEKRLFSHERRVLREMPRGKTIYVKVDRFKATLGDINKVRSNLRKSEEALSKLENIKHLKDKSFDKVRASLDDLQKKLIFVDKTLFKGE